MDPFALVVLGGLFTLIVVLLLLGKYAPGNGLDQVGLRSAREISELREMREAEDLEQMVAAHNARRRKRGQREVTADELEMRIGQELRSGSPTRP